MIAYRFCRTDDMALIVAARNRCVLAHRPDAAPWTVESFKRSIRELSVWCSSCMVAVSRGEPVGVLVGTKRDEATLVLEIAVHPDHLRRGYGRHMLGSLGRKLAILGPPRLLAEVPREDARAAAFFRACDFEPAGTLVDLRADAPPDGPAPPALAGLAAPASVEDLDREGLLADPSPVAWSRARASLLAATGRLEARAVAGPERIEAFVVARPAAAGAPRAVVRIGCAAGAPGPALLAELLDDERRRADGPLEVPRLSAGEAAPALLEGRGFRRGGVTDCLEGRARARFE